MILTRSGTERAASAEAGASTINTAEDGKYAFRPLLRYFDTKSTALRRESSRRGVVCLYLWSYASVVVVIAAKA